MIIKNKYKSMPVENACCLAIIFMVTSVISANAATLDVAKFDRNGNGLIDKGEEAEALIKHSNDELFRKADTDYDGKISTTEQAVYDTDLTGKLSADLGDFEDEIEGTGKDGMSLPKAEEFAGIDEPPSEPSWTDNIYIRKSHEVLGILEEAKERSKAQGAVFSYARDHEADNGVWTAQGAAMYRFLKSTGFAPKSSEGGITAYAFVPSVTFNRLSNTKKDVKDIDSLVFRLGGQLEYMGGSNFITGQYFRLNATYGTDFGFDSDVIGVEAEWEPVILNWGIGVARRGFGGALDYRWRGILHAEYGKTLDVGEKDNLNEDETFVRAGPKFSIGLWPTAIDRVGINASWYYLRGFSGNPNSVSMLESSLEYSLDKEGRFKLVASYQDGEQLITLDKTKVFSVGLSITQ